MPNGLVDAPSRGPVEHAVNGIWYNQHGSRIELVVSDSGAVQGTFRSPIGLSKGKDEARVLGFTSGNLISFVADFGRYASLTAWTGHVVGDGSESVMETQWQMTVAIPGRPSNEDLWRGIWTGSDTFQRQNPPRLQRLATPFVSFAVGALLGDAFIHLIPTTFADTEPGARRCDDARGAATRN